MTPDFRILANGALVTLAMQTRLLALTVTDEDGDKADRLQIDLDDPLGLIAMPEDAILSVALGFKGRPLADMGRFAVDGVSGKHPAQTISITATAANLKGNIRSPKTRAFEDKTLKDIVATIAGEAGLKPMVSASIAASRWAYLAQTTESNLHFLSRIAKTLDATAKAAGGALIVQRRGDGLTAAGDALIPPVLMQSALTSYDWDYDGRAVYKSVQAEYSDTGGGQVHSVTVGSGTPALRLRHVHATRDEATRAARAQLQGAARAAMTLSAQVAGFNPALLAGASVVLVGMSRAELNGEWHLKTVTHSLSGGGLTSSFTAKKGAP